MLGLFPGACVVTPYGEGVLVNLRQDGMAMVQLKSGGGSPFIGYFVAACLQPAAAGFFSPQKFFTGDADAKMMPAAPPVADNSEAYAEPRAAKRARCFGSSPAF